MKMAMLAADVGQDVIPYVHAIRDELLGQRQGLPPSFSGGYPLRMIRVGGAEYRLRRLVVGRLYPTSDGAFEFLVDDLAPHIVGRAMTPQAAIDDWRNRVHAAFQQLLAMRPFEMDLSDEHRWRALESIIDTAQFRRSSPVRMRQLGRVDYMRYSYPRAIRWAGAACEQVSLDVMPAEFPSFRHGQWIEGICERDPLTGRLLRVTHIERIPEIRMMSAEQQDKYWDTLPTGDSLPESDLDWTRSD